MRSLLLILFITSNALVWSATDRYRLLLRDDPATTICIGWDQYSGSSPLVHYDVVDHGTNWAAYSNTRSPDRIVSHKSMNNHFVHLTGLQPDTDHFFVIRDSEGMSASFWFRTCHNDPTQPLAFIAGGDSRNNNVPRQNANSLVSKLKPHAVLFGGDMTNQNTDAEWVEWFDDWQLTTSSDGRMIPIVAARGNHEQSNSDIHNLFDTPHPDVYYAINFGGSLVTTYTLNTEISISGTQSTWLVNDLQSDTSKWRMAQYHKGIRPHVSGKGEGNLQYANWAQPFIDHDVKLIVECDAHTCKTTWPIVPSTGPLSEEGFERDDQNGSVYVGEGCWGAPLRDADDAKVWTRDSGKFNQFKWIFVYPDSMEVRTIKVDNAPAVVELPNNDPFMIPAGIDIWNPSNGPLVTIYHGIAPTCDLTAPINGQQIAVPMPVTLQAQAFDADGSITCVEFLVGEVAIGCDSVAPYEMEWTIPANGSYTIHAIAIDDIGFTTTSSASTVFVGAVLGSDSLIVDRSVDDAEEWADGSIDLTSSDLELAEDVSQGSGDQHIGMRFRDLQVPNGAIITEAYLQFTTDEVSTGSCSLEIMAEASDDAIEFVDVIGNITSRPLTDTLTNWAPPDWPTTGVSTLDQRTPDLSHIVQEIIDRPGWEIGQAFAFIITGSGRRTAESFDGVPNAAARFKVSYTIPGVDCTGLVGGTAFPDTLCNDGDPMTHGDVYSSLCLCEGHLGQVVIKLLLEGAFDEASGLMLDDLRDQQLIPLVEPYSDLGYTYPSDGGPSIAGATSSIDPAVLNTTGPDAIVDWVVVELRDALDPSESSDGIIRSRSAMLQRDGDVVDLDGSSPIEFIAEADDYYIVVRHRNHLSAMSSSPLPFGLDLLSVDFTSPAVDVYDNKPSRNMIGNVMVQATGDVTMDGLLMYTGSNNDRDQILVAIGGNVPTNVVIAYHSTDLNMDGSIKYTGMDNDRDLILVNIGGSIQTIIRDAMLP